MNFCGCLNIDCSSCLNYSVEYCPPILINIPITNLINGNTYYLWVVDKFNNAYTDTILGNSDGSFNINQTNFPIGMFHNGFGKRDVFLTTDSLGNNIQILNYGSQTYNCIMLKVDNPIALATFDDCMVLSSNGTILLNG